LAEKQLGNRPRIDELADRFKSRTRNQHYLHEVVIVWRPLISPTSKRHHRRTCTLCLRCLEHCRQVALQLDFELSFLRAEDHRIDKAAQRFSGGSTALFVFQASRQLRSKD
jgi:ferredoxin